ncbi:uncharacterized protein LOC131031948 isoform X2 [Cryptomeria japonica]|uniref:uncharacterized protein LOC131031948 isoform X2 n=1 Tax=Cryptomeria japonica TaxID=3369 RepID=UPI0027DA601F|nr:uncharacterized protein LOC131031948 isoform X2 [Cryptomeria japonica]
MFKTGMRANANFAAHCVKGVINERWWKARRNISATKYMDEEWDLSAEELDCLEQDAIRRLAQRQQSSTATSSPLISSPPGMSGRSQLSVKIFKDCHGKIALETQYNPHLVAMLKSVAGHEWDQHRRVWTYPEGELENVEKALSSLPHIVASIYAVPPLNLPLKSREADYNAGGHIGGSPQAQKNTVAVQLYFIDQDRIAARSIYNERIKEACQSVQGRLWNAEEKVWTFPNTTLGELLDSLDKISSPSITVEALPPLVLPDTWCSRNLKLGKVMEPEGKSGITPSTRTKLFQNADQIKGKYGKCYVNLSIHSSGNIAARFPFQEQVIAAFRAVPKAEWSAKERLWILPISSLPDAERALAQIDGLEVVVESLDPFVRHALDASSKFPDLRGTYSNIPAFLENVLLPFQRDGVRFVLEHGGRALIADEMGLGKTLQAIAVASCLKDSWPVLVVTPSALRLQWAYMINQWLHICSSEISIVMSQWTGSIRDCFKVVYSSGKKGIQLDGLFNIVSYDLVPKLQETLMDSDFKIVIADESHYLKNGQAKRTDACIPLLHKAQHCILLTGTPALSRPIELFTQLQALHPSAYKNVHHYGQRYCKGGYFGTYQGASNLDELHALMKKTVMIRRLKKDVLSELPVKRRQQVLLSLDDKGLQQMRALFFELGSIKKKMELCNLDEEVQMLRLSQQQLISKIYTESAEVKIPAVLDYMQTMIEGGCKFLVFAHHLSMLDAIEQYLIKKKVSCIRIDGSTSPSSRQMLVTRFQERDDVKVAVLSIRAAGVGLTLTAATTVIFAELSWTPGEIVQAEDRTHRIGQVSSVNVYYLHANETVDDLIWDCVQHKLENLGQVLDGQENALEASSEQHFNLNKRQKKLDSFLQPCVNDHCSTKSSNLALEGDKDQR